MGENGNWDLPFLHSENEILSNGLDTKVYAVKSKIDCRRGDDGNTVCQKVSPANYC